MMRDCENAEMRDLLPELLHARLGGAERAAVERHVAACEDCAAELALLRRVQSSLARAPAVDVSRIVAALPRAGARRRPSRLTGWRVAAGIAAVLIGAVSIRVARQSGDTAGEVTSGVVASAPAPAPSVAVSPATGTGTRPESIAAASRQVVSAPRAARSSAAALTPAGGLSDLSDEQLELLLGQLDGLSGVPDTEPAPAISPVTLDEGVS